MNDKAIHARENLKKIFRENPEIYQAFKEVMQDMMKPENVERMARQIGQVMDEIKAIQKKSQGFK